MFIPNRNRYLSLMPQFNKQFLSLVFMTPRLIHMVPVKPNLLVTANSSFQSHLSIQLYFRTQNLHPIWPTRVMLLPASKPWRRPDVYINGLPPLISQTTNCLPWLPHMAPFAYLLGMSGTMRVGMGLCCVYSSGHEACPCQRNDQRPFPSASPPPFHPVHDAPQKKGDYLKMHIRHFTRKRSSWQQGTGKVGSQIYLIILQP